MKRRNGPPGLSLILAALALVASGCIVRDERIVIHPDGRVDVAYEFHGNADDLYGPGAALPPEDLFSVRRFTRELEHGEEGVYQARASFASVAAIPTTFSDPGPAPHQRAIPLRFTTDLYRHEHEGTTTFTFVRRFERRKWALYDRAWRRAFPKEVQLLFESGPIEQLSRKDRRRVLSSLVDYERRKQQAIVEEALAALDLTALQRVTSALATAQAIDRVVASQLNTASVDELLKESDEVITRRVDEIQQAITRAIETALRASPDFAGERLRQFQAQRESELAAFRVSEDLRGEDFRISVTLPGTILATNAQHTDGATARWEFSGDDLCDADVELVATAVLTER